MPVQITQTQSGQQHIVDLHGYPLRQSMGAYGAASTTSRDLGSWYARSLSGDAAVLPDKLKVDARSKDIARNNGIAASGVQLQIDSVVGHQFKLIARPNWVALGIDPNSEEATELSRQFEAQWQLYAEDPINCPMDAEGKRTFTDIIRAGVYHDIHHGESMGTGEWKARPGIPYRTCYKIINPDRICNPLGLPDTKRTRAGVDLDRHGEAYAYHLRSAHTSDDQLGSDSYRWRKIRKKTRWGRYQFIHVFDPMEDGQTRGISSFASVLARLKMLDKFQESVLQNAVINATYAMVIESEFDAETAMSALGAEAEQSGTLAAYVEAYQNYHGEANIRYDGQKIPHLFPGEKLNMQIANSPTGVADFEQGLLRYVAAGLGVSYEQLSKDYSKTNFSSARASLMETWRGFMVRRQRAKRLASHLYALWLEEAFSLGKFELPQGAPSFWEAKAAWCQCDWIGAGQTHIDGLKEAKRLVMLLEASLITEEKAHAELGQDYQEVFNQLLREKREREDKGLPPPLWMQAEKMSTSAAYQDAPAVNSNAATG